MSDYIIVNGELYHHGIKGMKWGRRRFQTKDGSLTPAGKKRYVTARQAGINARKAEKASIAADKARGGVTYRQASKNAQAARKASIEADRAYNKELRAEKKAKKAAEKTDAKIEKASYRQYGRLEDAYSYKKNPKEKDMYETYGKIEDSLTYSKYANKKAEQYAQKALDDIEKQLAQTGKNKSYDLTKVNSFIDEALSAIDDDLRKRKK